MKPGEKIIFETAAGTHRGTVKKTWGEKAMVIVETEEGEQTFYVHQRRVLADESQLEAEKAAWAE